MMKDKQLFEVVFIEVPSIHEQEAGAIPKVVAGPIFVYSFDAQDGIAMATLKASEELQGIEPGKIQAYPRAYKNE